MTSSYVALHCTLWRIYKCYWLLEGVNKTRRDINLSTCLGPEDEVEGRTLSVPPSSQKPQNSSRDNVFGTCHQKVKAWMMEAQTDALSHTKYERLSASLVHFKLHGRNLNVTWRRHTEQEITTASCPDQKLRLNTRKSKRSNKHGTRATTKCAVSDWIDGFSYILMKICVRALEPVKMSRLLTFGALRLHFPSTRFGVWTRLPWSIIIWSQAIDLLTDPWSINRGSVD